jgi:hypothetical protein
MKKYDDIKTKMIRYKARSYSSLVLGLIYLGWSYYFIEPIEHHETYQLIFILAVLIFAAVNSQWWADCNRILQEKRSKRDYDYRKREWKY